MSEALKRFRSVVEPTPLVEVAENIVGDLCRAEDGKFASCGSGAKKAFDPKEISSILAVRDTRDYMEQGDRLVPIAGSGEARQCDRCGRSHEVHVDVTTRDGSVYCVGGSCARGTAIEKEAASEVRKAISVASTVKRLSLTTDRLIQEAETFAAAAREVASLPTPPAVWGSTEDGRPKVTVGSGVAYYPVKMSAEALPPDVAAERQRSATNGWVSDELSARGVKRSSSYIAQDADAVSETVAKTLKKSPASAGSLERILGTADRVKELTRTGFAMLKLRGFWT